MGSLPPDRRPLKPDEDGDASDVSAARDAPHSTTSAFRSGTRSWESCENLQSSSASRSKAKFCAD